MGDLPKNAVVVRSGELKLSDFLKSLERHYFKYTEYALSVFCIPGLDAHQIAHAVGTDSLPHGKFMETRVETICAAGYEIKPSPHGTNNPKGTATCFAIPQKTSGRKYAPCLAI